MKLKVVSSSSKGNCYILTDSQGQMLILEAGVKQMQMLSAIGFKPANVVGCLITHEHGDHAKHAIQFRNLGIPTYATNGTIDAICKDSERDKERFSVVICGVTFQVGPFKILPFKVHHDCAEPVGYIIRHPESGDVVFATDTYYIDYKFRNISNWIIEANYCEDIVLEAAESGMANIHLMDRTFTSHLSLQSCIKTLKKQDLTSTNNIVLIHLSDRNSDEKMFEHKVLQETGIRPVIAREGLEIEFNKTAF